MRELSNIKKIIAEGFNKLSEVVDEKTSDCKQSVDEVVTRITRIENKPSGRRNFKNNPSSKYFKTYCY